MKLLDNFFANIPDLGHRRQSFEFICERLLEKNGPFFIVETGTTRDPTNFHGDGCSTIIWDKLNNLFTKNKSTIYSVDISYPNIQKAMLATKSVKFINDDSVTYLRQLALGLKVKAVDLLYLDSFDYDSGKEFLSMNHHLAELSAILPYLRPGCFIMVDDCHSPDAGKHVLVERYLNTIGVNPIFRGYQTIWKLP